MTAARPPASRTVRRRLTVLAIAAGLSVLSAGVPVAAGSGITAGPDGNVWFRSRSGPARIGRITPTGILTWFRSGIAGTPFTGGITTGADGNLWFTDFAGARIGRMTPGGAVTTFPLGMGHDLRPGDITAGPDGNVWFLANSRTANRVARITPEGVVTAFSAGIRQGGALMSIAPGSDGNLWFTDYGGGRIGRITPAGVVTEFRVPGGESPPASMLGLPDGIVAGPDGRMWFTASLGIGRISADGVITPVPVEGGPMGFLGAAIASDPEGNLWIADGSDVARVAPDGGLTRFVRPSRLEGDARLDIVMGPDGDLWFADYGVVARVSLTGAITEYPPAPVVRLRLERRRAVVVVLRCPRTAVARCAGRLLLQGAGLRFPVGRFAIAPGARARIVVPLRPAWRRDIRRRGSVYLVAWITPRPIEGSQAIGTTMIAGQAALPRPAG